MGLCIVSLIWVTEWFNEKATVKPQFKPTSLEDEYTIMQPTDVNTLPGTTSMVTPLAKSTPMTQASQMPTIPIVSPHVRGILEPSSNEQARAAYSEREMQGMSSVRFTIWYALFGGMAYQLGLKVSLRESKVIVKKRNVKGNMSGKHIE